MKPYKQASIPKGSVEVRFRGSKEDTGSFSAKLLIPRQYAYQALTYCGTAPKIKKSRKKAALHDNK
jgi:hypothetical protein